MTSAAGPLRKIGQTSVPAIGFGAMGLAAFYGAPSSQEHCNTVFKHLIDSGVQHIDTSDIYSSAKFGRLGENEEQLGKFFAANPGARDKVFLATKHVFTIGPNGERGMKASREYSHEALNASLKRLQTDHVDLYYLHRPAEPIEESIKGMKELQQEGKLKYIGVSEYNVEQLERAEKIAHIDALQIELSPWTPNILSNGILDWCKKNGTTVVAYSPLGRGLISGQIKMRADLEEGDFRLSNPRFSEENFPKNLELVEELKKIASKKGDGVSPGNIALAWCLAQSDNIVVIPGSTKVKNIEENVKSKDVHLSAEELKEIDGIIRSFKVSGDRYGPGMPTAF